ncbi:hypothetical protein [Bradyrhizobium sp. CSS354]|uniref:hypothetical protein n=1 Tax=Bradyrhizobium sp. CSS354 TaxID=2699172 RepID=UPI0023B1F9C5|nr:hypothetical protein [Bradyrhizobium sp. CSS354]MDE5459818.1 hypothetical protein [Bradyrhizobium sp. CSS354]
MSVLIVNALVSAQDCQLRFSGDHILSLPRQLKDELLLLGKPSFSLDYIAFDLPQLIIDEGLIHRCAQHGSAHPFTADNLIANSTFPELPSECNVRSYSTTACKKNLRTMR